MILRLLILVAFLLAIHGGLILNRVLLSNWLFLRIELVIAAMWSLSVLPLLSKAVKLKMRKHHLKQLQLIFGL